MVVERRLPAWTGLLHKINALLVLWKQWGNQNGGYYLSSS